jgi:hypothetical protein
VAGLLWGVDLVHLFLHFVVHGPFDATWVERFAKIFAGISSAKHLMDIFLLFHMHTRIYSDVSDGRMSVQI